jgi:hypothetical protein
MALFSFRVSITCITISGVPIRVPAPSAFGHQHPTHHILLGERVGIGQVRGIRSNSYAAAVWGWHWGWKIANTGLPIQLTSLRNIRSAWSFNLSHTILGGTNVTYDIWLSENPHLDEENPTGEVMVWLYNTGDISPIGSKQTYVTIE